MAGASTVRELSGPLGPDGDEITIIELANEVFTARFLPLGAALWQLVPHGETDEASLCLFHRDPAAYAVNEPAIGAFVGPVANRISASRFELGGAVYELEANEGPNHLHGGPNGFGTRRWNHEIDPSTGTVRFSIHRPDGQDGYPGSLDLSVEWTLDGSTLNERWTAISDRPTPVSPTNHAYWNLDAGGTVLDHRITVAGDHFVELDPHLIPTGAVLSVDATAYDLRASTRVGDVVDATDGAGPDVAFMLTPGGSVTVTNGDGSRSLTVATSLPCAQVYAAGKLDGTEASGGHRAHAGICVETHHPPDAVNRPGFRSPIVEPGQPVSHWTTHRFKV